MPREDNVEIVRCAYVAAVQRPRPDFETVNKLYHPDHELISLASRVEGGSVRGARGFRQFLDTLDEAFGSWEVEVKQIESIDDERVLLVAVAIGVGRHSSATVEQPFAHVMTVHGGKLTRTEVYSSLTEAREALGLSA